MAACWWKRRDSGISRRMEGEKKTTIKKRSARETRSTGKYFTYFDVVVHPNTLYQTEWCAVREVGVRNSENSLWIVYVATTAAACSCPLEVWQLLFPKESHLHEKCRGREIRTVNKKTKEKRRGRGLTRSSPAIIYPWRGWGIRSIIVRTAEGYITPAAQGACMRINRWDDKVESNFSMTVLVRKMLISVTGTVSFYFSNLIDMARPGSLEPYVNELGDTAPCF